MIGSYSLYYRLIMMVVTIVSDATIWSVTLEASFMFTESSIMIVIVFLIMASITIITYVCHLQKL